MKKLQKGSRTRADFDDEVNDHFSSAFVAYMYNEAKGVVGKPKLRCQVVVVSDIDPEGPEWRAGVRKWSTGFLPGEDTMLLSPPKMVRSIQGSSLDGMCDARTGE